MTRAEHCAALHDAAIQRAKAFAVLFRSGKTYQEIADLHGLTRQRVQQLISKIGVTRNDGGGHFRAELNDQKRAIHMDVMSVRKWGCAFSEYQTLRDMKKPTRAFASQRNAARHRGIGWELTLWDWWLIWQESGKWEQRGRGFGYVMARFGDIGPYARGNVEIIPQPQNIKDGWVNRPRSMRKPWTRKELRA